MPSRTTLRTSTNVDAVLNTIEHERHAPEALLVAFAEELSAAFVDRSPDSTRDLLARARRGELARAEVRTLLDELRALASAA